MSKITIPFEDQIVIINFGDFDDSIDIDQFTSIDYSNLFGESVTVSALLNRFGLLKATAESYLSRTKLDLDIYTANLQKKYRREANVNGGKFTLLEDGKEVGIKLTEDSLLMAITLDLAVQNKRKAIIEAQKNLGYIDSIYWAIKSKDDKLSVMMKGVTPKEFVDGIIEGKINGMMISKKHYGNFNS